MSQSLYTLVLIFLLASCGKSGGSSSGKKVVPLNPEEMEDILDHQEFTCRVSPSRCPYGIGRIFILNPSDYSSSSLCTGFMVGPTKMLTNHHCISDQEDCRNTYVSVRTVNGPVKARCKSLQFTREDSTNSNQKSVDLSVIELDRTIVSDRFTLSSVKVKTGENYVAWVVDQVSLTQAIITRLDCLYERKDFSMIMRNCPAISGNSGSPVVRSSGEVVGILWGSSLPQSVDANFPFDLRLALTGISAVTELFPFRTQISGSDSSLR